MYREGPRCPYPMYVGDTPLTGVGQSRERTGSLPVEIEVVGSEVEPSKHEGSPVALTEPVIEARRGRSNHRSTRQNNALKSDLGR